MFDVIFYICTSCTSFIIIIIIIDFRKRLNQSECMFAGGAHFEHSIS